MVKRIVFTGSHGATTAMAIVQQLQKSSRCDWQIAWIGSKRPVEGIKKTPFESSIFPGMNVDYFSIDSGRAQIKFSLWTIPALLKMPRGLVQALLLLRKLKPDLVFSVGGSAGFLVSLAAKIMGIRVYVHEQTSVAGRANLATARFADKVLISRKTSFGFFPRRKTLLVGNPVRESIKKIEHKSVLSNPPVLLVLGGSRGARVVNHCIEPILANILEKAVLIHQTGPVEVGRFAALKEKLPPKLRQRYQVHGFIKALDEYYKTSDIVVSRSGANIVSELLILKKPSILIPIPWSHNNEQYKNAKLAADSGIAVVLDQANLTPAVLLAKIMQVYKDWPKMILSPTSTYAQDDSAAAQRICEIINNSF
ncbi:MAG: hypothetical protein ACD_52C00285G0003 [uncultured bacterium]|nr:MAG: hypothetical protein ACD_52C00285G0003 [uncultured bacterium]